MSYLHFYVKGFSAPPWYNFIVVVNHLVLAVNNFPGNSFVISWKTNL